ncbi:MAG: MBL fold metallo-hydrolase [Nitriliruptoraceae bacterium]|nr:MBL fold metallo-hydrolase [Nitriliruptoraceae bacterium]
MTGRRRPADWFDVQQIDPMTFAIREPRYWQRTVSYLILGHERALVFDTGSGNADLSVVTSALTPLPVTALASHVHYDHIGSHPSFSDVAAPAIPEVLHQVRGRTHQAARRSTLTPRRRRLTVTRFVAPGATLDLGGRHLVMHHTPGHTPDSVSLHDRERGQMFVGDFLYDGPLTFGVLPGSDLETARHSAQLLAGLGDTDTVLPGHYGPLDGNRLSHFARCLETIDNGPGPRTHRLLHRFELDGFRFLLWRHRPSHRTKSATR